MVRMPKTAVRHAGATVRNGRMVLKARAPAECGLLTRTGPVERRARDSKSPDPRGVSNKKRSLWQLASQCRCLMATVTVHPGVGGLKASHVEVKTN
jgi:hypothetical protein